MRRRGSCPILEFELLFVDDGSSDDTLEIMRRLRQSDPRVRYLSFSRNFGKEAALLAGFEHATGELLTVMDATCRTRPRCCARCTRR